MLNLQCTDVQFHRIKSNSFKGIELNLFKGDHHNSRANLFRLRLQTVQFMLIYKCLKQFYHILCNKTLGTQLLVNHQSTCQCLWEQLKTYLLTKTDYEMLLGIFLYQYAYISSPFDGVIVEMEFPSSTGKLLSSKMFNHFFIFYGKKLFSIIF